MRFVTFTPPSGHPDVWIDKMEVAAIVRFPDRTELVLNSGVKFNVEELPNAVLAKLESK